MPPMTYYADSGERADLIAGLRALASYLNANPAVPAPPWMSLLTFPLEGTCTEQRAEIDAIAARIGAETRDNGNGHYTASRFFGPVEYRAVAICHHNGHHNAERT
jgi:hypothetical protein